MQMNENGLTLNDTFDVKMERERERKRKRTTLKNDDKVISVFKINKLVFVAPSFQICLSENLIKVDVIKIEHEKIDKGKQLADLSCFND